MALPKIKHTLYEHFLVGMNSKVKYRPFTNHEQKTLLLAKEESTNAKGANSEIIINAINEIIRGCTNGKVDCSQLATFDVEDLFMRIRAKSVGEDIKLKYRYDYTDEEGKPKSRFIDVNLNIDDIKVQVKPDHSNKIMLSENLGVVMKYPTFGILKNLTTDEDIAIACIDYIFDENEVYSASEASEAELKEFYDDIDTKGLLAIKKFFDTMPKISHTVQVDIGDGKTESVTYEGLEDFFS